MGLTVGSLYCNIGEFKTALQYLMGYLNIYPRSIETYHLIKRCVDGISENTIEMQLIKQLLNNCVEFCQSRSPVNQTPNIIGHLLNDGSILDEYGNISTEHEYINNVYDSAAQHFSSFGVAAEEEVSTEEVTQKLSELIYDVEQAPADSTTEEGDTIQKSRRVPVKPLKKKSAIECPIKNCFSIINHEKNVKRHIHTFHGKLQKKGKYASKYTITRYICKICKKSNVCDFNFTRHFQSSHEKGLKNMNKNKEIRITVMPEIVFKNKKYEKKYLGK